MSSNNYSYPHPILGNYDDILPMLKENECVHAEIVSDSENHYYQFTLTIEDQTILDLIADGKAQYAIHYKCRDTLLEDVKYGKENIQLIKIPRKYVVGKIDFFIYVVAKEDFVYSNPSANPIFMGASFDVHCNEPLVIFPYHYDNLDRTFHVLKHYSSILVPVPDDKIEGNDILIKSEEKIEVHISKETYDKLKKVNKQENTLEIISSYVQNALLTSLFELFNGELEIDEIRNCEKAWVQAILRRMSEENMPSLEDVNERPFEYIPSLVQRLLNYPMGNLLDKLVKNDVGDSDSEDEIIA